MEMNTCSVYHRADSQTLAIWVLVQPPQGTRESLHGHMQALADGKQKINPLLSHKTLISSACEYWYFTHRALKNYFAGRVSLDLSRTYLERKLA